jgi:hypothetical protein
MARRPTYAALCPLRLLISVKQDAFLRTMATEQGIGKAELLRRILQDTLTSWTKAGLYVPPLAQPENQEMIRGQTEERNGR